MFVGNLQSEESKVVINIMHKFIQLNLSTEIITIYEIGRKGDRVFAFANLVEGRDVLYADLHNRKKWRQDSPFWTHLSHSDGVSFRTPKNASLQVTMHYTELGERFYELDMDNWAPCGVIHGVNSVRHIFWEVLRNKLTGHVTDQNRIENSLNIADFRKSLKRRP